MNTRRNFLTRFLAGTAALAAAAVLPKDVNADTSPQAASGARQTYTSTRATDPVILQHRESYSGHRLTTHRIALHRESRTGREFSDVSLFTERKT